MRFTALLLAVLAVLSVHNVAVQAVDAEMCSQFTSDAAIYDWLSMCYDSCASDPSNVGGECHGCFLYCIIQTSVCLNHNQTAPAPARHLLFGGSTTFEESSSDISEPSLTEEPTRPMEGQLTAYSDPTCEHELWSVYDANNVDFYTETYSDGTCQPYMHAVCADPISTATLTGCNLGACCAYNNGNSNMFYYRPHC
eukprot:TRINITY_DN1398_c0_g1::TRINITY_DN1398_c0_g1_i1::g.19981::m.19981 TRINITY_DN1398_c0_g1::TRINITY_DN1398_c0_g1_i1::g.19981  ORF type:complete len:220 (+),score=43.75,DUF4006/PF13179.1/0.16 TRINITY_DN1398_c0_g1_i1:75-662(+)